ncbi:SDR family NAD(P)-dependent oxidoreductase [Rhodospirillum sp. A1_3_36]|uniref:SDR family NAD(P)-dependent oxidoreductase n=1 Tax=Rhodospirillum sp. A1_3_36 TaxID=3391666 RepID=UPI0039A57D33
MSKTKEQRVVIVTGGGIGIGRATCAQFSAQGDHVVITDVLEDEGRALAEELTAAGGDCVFLPLNVRDTAQAEAVVAEVVARHGKVDVVVANAGIAHRVPLAELSDEKWDETFDIDLKGMLRVIRPAVPAMGAGSSIICLSSIMGVAYGWDAHVHYSSAKAGVVGLVRGLAVELARSGIRVNGVAPGYIRTAQLLSEKNSLGPKAAEIASPYIPMGRLGEPEEIAKVIGFLASADASYLTGQVLTVDGGLLVGRY